MIFRKTALLALAVALIAPSGARAGEQPHALRVSGSGAALGALRLLADAYIRANPGARLEVFPSVGSTGAIKAVADRALDVGISLRPLRPEEEALGLLARPFARTPLVFATGTGVEATSITLGELVQILRGDRTTWPGGARLRFVLRPASDTDTLVLRALSPELSAALDVAYGREGMLQAATNQDCTAMLRRTPGSIGPSTLVQLRAEREGLRPLAWNGVQPTIENLASGAYPISHTLSVVVRAHPSPQLRCFLDFLRSPTAGRILREAGAIPLPMAPLD